MTIRTSNWSCLRPLWTLSPRIRTFFYWIVTLPYARTCYDQLWIAVELRCSTGKFLVVDTAVVAFQCRLPPRISEL